MKRPNIMIILGCLLCLAFSLLTQNSIAQTGNVLSFGYNLASFPILTSSVGTTTTALVTAHLNGAMSGYLVLEP